MSSKSENDCACAIPGVDFEVKVVTPHEPVLPVGAASQDPKPTTPGSEQVTGLNGVTVIRH